MKSQKKYPTSTVKELQSKFPKFSKVTLCMVNNPEYGVDISKEGKRWLNQQKNKSKTKMSKSKVVSARVDDDTAEKLSQYLKGKGLTTAEFLSQVIKETVDEASLHKGMPGQGNEL